jgi:hypothetical protein
MTNGVANISVRRESAFFDRFRDYRILLDGREIGRIGNGQEKSFQIDPGEHELLMTIDWCSSSPVRFLAVSGQDSRFRCGSGIRGKRFWFSLYYVVFARRQYVWLAAE